MPPAAPYPRRLRDHASVRRAPIRATCNGSSLAAVRGVTPANALEVAHQEFDRIVNLMMLTVDLLRDVHDDGERANIPAIRKATTRVLGNARQRHSSALERLGAFKLEG